MALCFHLCSNDRFSCFYIPLSNYGICFPFPSVSAKNTRMSLFPSCVSLITAVVSLTKNLAISQTILGLRCQPNRQTRGGGTHRAHPFTVHTMYTRPQTSRQSNPKRPPPICLSSSRASIVGERPGGTSNNRVAMINRPCVPAFRCRT